MFFVIPKYGEVIAECVRLATAIEFYSYGDGSRVVHRVKMLYFGPFVGMIGFKNLKL